MTTTNLGKVSVTPKGEYDPLITYERLDVISHNGSSYIVKQASTGVTPIEGEFYALIAEKGDGGSFVKKAYKTYAAMDADKVNIPANSSVDVTNDPDESKNGAYIYDGSAFTRSQYDSKVVTDKIISDTAIAVQDAINNTAVEGGVLADTFVTKTANGEGQVARTQRDKNSDILNARDFGVVGDGVVDDTAAIQKAVDYSALSGSKLIIPKGTYITSDSIFIGSGSYISFEQDAWITPVKWSVVGAVLTNVVPTTYLISGERTQECVNTIIENPQLDGSRLPYGNKIQGAANDNALGFSEGADGVYIINGHVKNFRFHFAKGGNGGKGINFEIGCKNCHSLGVFTAENCGTAIQVKGFENYPTTEYRGKWKGSKNITINRVFAKYCETAVIIAGVNYDTGAIVSPEWVSTVIGSVYAYNCGHSYSRPDKTSKGGIISLVSAVNAHIGSVFAYTDSDYTTKMNSVATTSNGLEGPVGAVIWGWGNNITIDSVHYTGDVDTLVRLDAVYAVGDDGRKNFPDGTIKGEINVDNFFLHQLVHTGTVADVLGLKYGTPEDSLKVVLNNIHLDEYTRIVNTSTAATQRNIRLHYFEKDGTEVEANLPDIYSKFQYAHFSNTKAAEKNILRNVAVKSLKELGDDTEIIMDKLPILVLATGQSNSLGVSGLGPQGDIDNKPRIWSYEQFPESGQTVGWKFGFKKEADYPQGSGGNAFDYHFADILQRTTGRPVVIIKHSAGGQPIAEWLPSGGSVPGATGHMHSALSATYESALTTPLPFRTDGKSLEDLGITTADYMLWHQGEADADDRGETAAKTDIIYIARFEKAIDAMKGIGTGAIPKISDNTCIIVGQLYLDGALADRNTALKELSEKHERVKLALCGHLPAADSLHFDAIQIPRMALAYYDAIG